MMRQIRRLAAAFSVFLVAPVAPAQQPSARPAPPAAPAARTEAPAQPDTQPAPDPAAQRKIDGILAGWEKASTQINTLYAEFEQKDLLRVVGEEKRFAGKAYLQRPNLALLQMDMYPPDAGPDAKPKFHSRIVCTGSEVLEFDASTKQILIYPLPADARERAMEQGPLPFLFNMKVDDFKRRYDIRLHAETEDQYRIVIRPLHEIDQHAFSVAVLYLSKKTLLPVGIFTRSPNGQDEQHYRLQTVRPNARWEGNMFTWTSAQEQAMIDKGWNIVRNPAPVASAMPAQGQGELEPIPGRDAVGRAPAARPAPR